MNVDEWWNNYFRSTHNLVIDIDKNALKEYDEPKSIEEKIKGIFFFTFSEGSYSDYGICGVYACDHEVTKKEWDEFEDNYNQETETKKSEFHIPVKKRPNIFQDDPNQIFYEEDWNSIEYQNYCDWKRDRKTPAQQFIDKHNMVEITYKEFWRDY